MRSLWLIHRLEIAFALSAAGWATLYRLAEALSGAR